MPDIVAKNTQITATAQHILTGISLLWDTNVNKNVKTSNPAGNLPAWMGLVLSCKSAEENRLWLWLDLLEVATNLTRKCLE